MRSPRTRRDIAGTRTTHYGRLHAISAARQRSKQAHTHTVDTIKPGNNARSTGTKAYPTIASLTEMHRSHTIACEKASTSAATHIARHASPYGAPSARQLRRHRAAHTPTLGEQRHDTVACREADGANQSTSMRQSQTNQTILPRPYLNSRRLREPR